MKFKRKQLIYSLLCCVTISGPTLAGTVSNNSNKNSTYKDSTYKDIVVANPNHWEVIGGLGAAKLRANNFSSIGVTSSETDTLV